MFWLDNCSSQNKNWVMFSMMIVLVNQDDGPQSITLRYFVPGHTHMAQMVSRAILKKLSDTKESVRHAGYE